MHTDERPFRDTLKNNLCLKRQPLCIVWQKIGVFGRRLQIENLKIC